MQRSTAVAVAFAVLCASQCVSALGEHDAAPGCASGTCSDGSSDETSLLQTVIQKHHHQARVNSTDSPLLGNLTSIISSVTDAVATVTDELNTAALSTITTLADSVAGTLESLKDQLDTYVQDVNSTAAVIESGVATLLSQAFDMTFDGVAVGEEYVEKTMSLLETAEKVWTSIVQAMQTLAASIDSALALVGSPADEIRQQLSTAMQVVISKAEGVLDAVETVESTLQNLTSNATSAAKEAAKSKSTALLQTKLDPVAVLDTLNAAVAEASEEASALADAISNVSATLIDEIPDIVKDLLGADAVAQVNESLEKVSAAAADLVNEVASATQVLSGITEVTSAAADALSAKSGAVGQPLARWGLGAAAAAALAAVIV